MSSICSIDEDNDYGNDLRILHCEAKQPVDYERRIRRLRRHSAKPKCLQSSHNWKGDKQVEDDNYSFFLNFYDKGSPFHHVDDTDSDPQYHKFLSFLKPIQISYPLDLVKGDGTSDLVTYEDVNEISDKPAHNANLNAGGKNNGGMLLHSGNYTTDIGDINCFKSTYKQSQTVGRLVMEDKMGAENAGHPPLEESLIPGSEFTSIKSVGADSQMCFVDVSYQFYLSEKFNLKVGEKLSCPQDLKKPDLRSVVENNTKETPRKRKLSTEAPKKRKLTTETPINHKLGSKVCTPHIFYGSEGKKPKLGNNNRRLGYSKQATERKLDDRVAEDATGLYALQGVQSSEKKPGSKNHNHPGSGLKFDRPISNSYKTYLSCLRVKEGHLVFQSEEGKVVTYEKDLKGNSTDPESDSDSVIITGTRTNGIHHKYCSSVPRKSSFQDMELDKNRTSKDSPFGKTLMNILRKPYDRDEYESLMELAEKRRPLEGYRDLRGGRKGTYEMESLGKSYLDHHKDAAEAIRRCKGDRPKKMIILRGFIYWLEHVADANQFKPWLDKECLEVQPRK